MRAGLKRGKKVAAAGGGRVNGTGIVTLKTRGRLEKGAHTLVVTASDGQTQGSAARRVKVTK